MTKKRFVKLLMARGIRRNDANRYAWFAYKFGTPYAVEIQDDFYN